MSEVSSKMNNRGYLLIIGLILVISGLVWSATRRFPLDPKSGRGAKDQAKFCKTDVNLDKLRIASFNVHRCKGRDGRRDVDRVAKLLQDMDIVGLNEVHGDIFGDSTNQAEILGNKLQMAWLFAPTNRRLLNGDFGNGLLTKLPVRSWQSIPLPKNRCKSNRMAFLAVLEHEPRPINLLIAHLGHRRDGQKADDSTADPIQRERDGHVQLDTVTSLFMSLAEPAVLMGDFNAFANDPLIKRLQNTPGVTDALARADTAGPENRVDWIFVRGLKCINAKVVPNEASDHPMAWTEVEPIAP